MHRSSSSPGLTALRVLRRGLALPLLLIGLAGLPGASWAAHALALGATPKYPENFANFDYVNPDAPKGGSINLDGFGSFDKLNPFTLRGLPAAGLGELMFETLAEQSWDEPFSVYGLLAEDLELAPDRLSITFRLDRRARFWNGDPVLAADVIHSFRAVTSAQAHPRYGQYFADVQDVVAVSDRVVRFEFKRVNPELHLIIATGLPIFSRQWGEGRPFDQIAQVEPLTTGPYRIDRIDYGKTIVYRRNPNYWGSGLPLRRGMYNFDRITYKYFKDETARLEGFKAGEFDWIFENSAKNWARGHTGRRYATGQLVKNAFPNENVSGMQGFAMNLRRPLFQDIRVRKALTLAFDFEWMNRQVFFDQYSRTASFFSNSPMAATGRPQGAELALLSRYRDQLDPAVFNEDVPLPPVTTPPSSLRDNLRKALDLLAEAGWTVADDGVLRNAQGQPFVFEVLSYSPTLERIAVPWVRNLGRLGIRVNLRVNDRTLYQKRLDEFDFDVTTHVYPMSTTPGNELRQMFMAFAADQPGSDNLPGIRDAVLEPLIDAVVQAPDREALTVAARALDRVLRHGWYLVPHFHLATHRVASNYRLAWPETLPKYYQASLWMARTWWLDPDAEPRPRQ